MQSRMGRSVGNFTSLYYSFPRNASLDTLALRITLNDLRVLLAHVMLFTNKPTTLELRNPEFVEVSTWLGMAQWYFTQAWGKMPFLQGFGILYGIYLTFKNTAPTLLFSLDAGVYD